MKRITLLGSKDPGGKNDINIMFDKVSGQTDVEVNKVFFEDLLMHVKTGQQSIVDSISGEDLADADFVIAVNWYKRGKSSINRDFGFATALYLKDRGVAFWNSEMGNQRSVSKLSAMMQLSLADIPVPETYFSLNSELLAQSVASTPYILKSAAASRGNDNYLCNSSNEIAEKVNSDGPNHFLVQEFIPNESDLRVVCFGGEPAMVIERRRINDDTHMNNTSQGAEATTKEIADLPPKIIEECKNICYSMGREMAGIDLLFESGSDRHVYLEVNAVPQLTSGSFVDQKMAVLAQSINKIAKVD